MVGELRLGQAAAMAGDHEVEEVRPWRVRSSSGRWQPGRESTSLVELAVARGRPALGELGSGVGMGSAVAGLCWKRGEEDRRLANSWVPHLQQHTVFILPSIPSHSIPYTKQKKLERLRPSNQTRNEFIPFQKPGLVSSQPTWSPNQTHGYYKFSRRLITTRSQRTNKGKKIFIHQTKR
jgi:hypothetical protein